MKKISLICGMLLALASSVYAYDNDYTHKISTETATKILREYKLFFLFSSLSTL